MRIAVIGAGGVGGYFGARLRAGGNDVTFVARGAHLAAMRRSGLLVRGPLGEIRTPPGCAVGDPADLGPTDLVLVAVKLWDTEEVAARLRPLTEQGAYVLSLQNGVHKDDILRRHLPAASVLGGTCFVSAVIEEPGVVGYRGTLGRLAFGPYEPGQEDIARRLLDACRAAGVEADLSADVRRVIWEKFVFLVGLSGATASVRQPIGVILAHDRTRALLRDLMAETAAVARASGVGLDEGFADRQLAFCDTLPSGMTSSLHQDLQRGNRLELPWLSGGVADLAGPLGIPVPRNRAVADILAPYVHGTPAEPAAS
ncbi:ketopantoate reductase family protein [Streptomyces sp. 7-21]|uniref:ketopantoate reductase family protein n=1 Tax=Streptomyces sp. 7-21 TaxID=2802283 RepID=UPI00191D283A|nr:2-dehydropantoate 2-reductase [Streptomyces sp. 7-21]MBL1068030.1 2-dehydropantoate 2-reductase [Streptomyces sp. 7-21]